MARPTPNSLTLEQIALELAPFDVALSQQQLVEIQKYIELLLHWNQLVSLTAIDDPVEIVRRHFGESIFAGTFLRLGSGRLADVGTGAGFPGVAIKLAFPDTYVVLVEPNLKKCAFLNEIKSALQLSRLEIVRSRFEEYRCGDLFDFVCCRALGDHRHFLQWARRALAAKGQIALWLGAEDSLRISRMNDWIWDAPVKIPESRRRIILCGRQDCLPRG